MNHAGRYPGGKQLKAEIHYENMCLNGSKNWLGSACTSKIAEDLETCTCFHHEFISMEHEHEVLNLDSTGTRCNDILYLKINVSDKQQVEFKRISLTGFRSCTSRSRYRSVSKQTTRYIQRIIVVLQDDQVLEEINCAYWYRIFTKGQKNDVFRSRVLDRVSGYGYG
ncbi:hypothetical protein Tco_1283040 [Tanacetum coccineum]